jgi:preprotein translocase subunit SecE
MNTKASNVRTSTSAADLLKYAIALLVAAAGVAVFYFVPSLPAPIRGLLVVLGFAGALALVAMTTALGHRGRDFFSESLFELRKVVWPTRQEAMRITGVVLLVVLIISLILAGFDFVISQLIKLLLSN